LGSMGSNESGDSGVDLGRPHDEARSPIENLDPNIERLVESAGSVEAINTRPQQGAIDRQRNLVEATEHLERCRFLAGSDEIITPEEAADLEDYRLGLLAARQARLTNGTPVPIAAPVPIPPPMEQRRPTAMYNMREAVVLEKYIDVVLAERFREQARKPTFMATWDEVILPEALDLIKLRLINMHVELGLTREAADSWTPEGQTLLALAETICDLFGRPTRTETTVEINDFIYDFNFGFKLGDRSYEETSIQNFKKLLKDHYGPINEIDVTTQDRICKLLYKKFPKHTELSDYLKIETAKECGTRQGVELSHENEHSNPAVRLNSFRAQLKGVKI
jgi:hypothetical protein